MAEGTKTILRTEDREAFNALITHCQERGATDLLFSVRFKLAEGQAQCVFSEVNQATGEIDDIDKIVENKDGVIQWIAHLLAYQRSIKNIQH